MNRSWYYNYIEGKLNTLSVRISRRNKQNLTELNIHAESFFAELMNHLLGYHLQNLNRMKRNMSGIDLIDEDNKVIMQVSATCTRQKIEHSLARDILQDYSGYHFCFIAISGEADNLRTKSYQNPYNVTFTPKTDIYDIQSLLDIVLYMDIHK
ncbi:MAG: SMEK domain-containing protein [Lachnospiraceae bacterium]|nr:SMEK domain-containing protein [Lachnospiraceae bacterium]